MRSSLIFILLIFCGNDNLYSQTKPSDGKPTAYDLSQTGLKLVDEKKYSEALPYFSEALNKVPYLEKVYVYRGRCYLNLEQFDKARADFKMALKIRPYDDIAHMNLGFCYTMMKDNAAAVSSFSEAIKIEKDPLYYLGRAEAYYNLKKYGDAFNDYQLALDFPGQDTAYIYFNMGKCTLQQSDYVAAILFFSNVIKLQPQNSDALCNRGVCYANIEKYELAIKDFDATLALDPDSELALKCRKLCQQDILDQTH